LHRLTTFLRPRRAKAAAVLTLAAVGLGALIATGSPATADPKQYSAATGVGSDTTQDVMNALAGFGNGVTFPPAQSSVATGKRQLVSWDAIGSSCITPKAPGATFTRPNGSSAGRRALSRAIDGTSYDSASCGGGTKPVSGLVQFARSSAGPSGAGTDLTYLPFGRDGMSFAYYRSSGAPVTSLTSAQLTSLFSTGPQTIGGVEIVPCGIQTGSGTFQFWNTALGVTATEATGTSTCNNAALAAGLNTGTGGRAQENDGNGLKARGDLAAFAGKQVIIGFSAANFISQANGVVVSQLPAPAGTVDLGAIDALGKPYTGTAAAPTPSSTFYASTTYGRDVYNVVSKALLDGPGNNDIKTLFVGPTSGVCSLTSTIQQFGFLSLGASCGSTSLTGPLVSGTL
jgi:ABC-type phosphate transport system substrate-binding protein